MGWRYERWVVEHPLPLGASARPAVGTSVRAGGAVARGGVGGWGVGGGGGRKLGGEGEDVDGVARVRIGTDVTRGTVLARTGRRFARAVTAPVDGRLVHRSFEGDFYIAPITGTWTVRASMDGTVVRSDDAAVTIEGSAWGLGGGAAYGPDAFGELALGVDAPADEMAPARVDVKQSDKILVGGARIAAEVITRAHACGVAGLVAGAAPAGGLRVVYGEEGTAARGADGEVPPTVLRPLRVGHGPLPQEIYPPPLPLSRERAPSHVGSARLFVFAPEALLDALDAPPLVLAGDFGGVRPLEGETGLTGVTRFPSDTYCEGLATKDGVVPVPNVLPYDAPR